MVFVCFVPFPEDEPLPSSDDLEDFIASEGEGKLTLVIFVVVLSFRFCVFALAFFGLANIDCVNSRSHVFAFSWLLVRRISSV